MLYHTSLNHLTNHERPKKYLFVLTCTSRFKRRTLKKSKSAINIGDVKNRLYIKKYKIFLTQTFHKIYFHV